MPVKLDATAAHATIKLKPRIDNLVMLATLFNRDATLWRDVT